MDPQTHMFYVKNITFKKCPDLKVSIFKRTSCLILLMSWLAVVAYPGYSTVSFPPYMVYSSCNWQSSNDALYGCTLRRRLEEQDNIIHIIINRSKIRWPSRSMWYRLRVVALEKQMRVWIGFLLAKRASYFSIM